MRALGSPSRQAARARLRREKRREHLVRAPRLVQPEVAQPQQAHLAVHPVRRRLPHRLRFLPPRRQVLFPPRPRRQWHVRRQWAGVSARQWRFLDRRSP